MRKTAFAIVILFSILLGAALASGQSPPIPHGIDGIIYTAEEPSRQVPAGTSFIINNTATGKHIQGKTGQGPLTGRYSVVIDGNDGDLLAIRAWNQLYEATKSVVLEGSMHGINLYLMTESGNSNPVIVSNPNVTATVNIAYYYKVSAQDADGDALTYQLGQAPTGMQIDAQGLVTWVPGQAGSYSVTVEVSDGQGSAQQAFIISVSGKPGSPIAFISVPVTQARVGHPYSYQASATGGEAALAYSLIQSPAGMTIGAVSGLVQWTPSGSGAYNVAIKASDGLGNNATQGYSLSVTSENRQPIILSSPLTEVKLGESYSYDVEGYDFDGDALKYSLQASPEGMTINQNSGLISWEPKPQQAGEHQVVARVADPYGAYAEQNFTLTVQRGNPVPYRLRGLVVGPDATQALRNTIVIVNNTNSGFVAELSTGIGINTGEFGIVMRGYQGDIVVVTAFNSTHIGQAKVQLEHALPEIRILMKQRDEPLPDISQESGEVPQRTKTIERQVLAAKGTAITKINIEISDDIEDVQVDVREVQDTQPLKADGKVYQLLEISVQDNNQKKLQGRANLEFKVEKQWLSGNSLDKGQVVMQHFQQSWNTLPTKEVKEDEQYIYYEASTPGFSIFAITALTYELKKPQASSLPSSFSISGIIIDDDDAQLKAGTPISVVNAMTGHAIKDQTGQGPNSGGFSFVIDGNPGDTVLLIVGAGDAQLQLTLGDNLDGMLLRYNPKAGSLASTDEDVPLRRFAKQTNPLFMKLIYAGIIAIIVGLVVTIRRNRREQNIMKKYSSRRK